jgi:hypothetical protein
MKKLITFLIAVSLMGTACAQAQGTFKTNVVIQKTTPTLYFKGTGGIIDFNTNNMRLTHSTGVLTLSGGNFAMGTGNLSLTGSISTSAARSTKGWFTNLEITNSPTVNGTSISSIYAPIASPAFIGTVTGITATMVGLGSVTNESKATMFTSPTFTGTPIAATATVGTNTTQIATTAFVLANAGGGGGAGTWGSITGTLSAQTDLANALALKANSASPTFTGTVSGITKTMVGLGNVTNESKVTMFTSPSFTGTVAGITATMVGLGNVTNESKVTMFANPTFTGTVTGVTKTMVGLGNVENSSKATLFTSPTFTGTVVMPSTTSIGTVSATEISYIDGATSNIQGQLDNTIELSAAVPTLTGVAIPQMSTTTINAISVHAEGLLVYDITLHVLKFWNGSAWKTITTN